MIFCKKKNAFSVSQLVNVALAEVCGSTVEKGGEAGAEFSADVTFSQWFCSLINVCSSLLCLFERNIALQPKILGNVGDLYEQNDVSVSKVQFRFKVFIPRIPSVVRYRGKSLALYTTHTNTSAADDIEHECRVTELSLFRSVSNGELQHQRY